MDEPIRVFFVDDEPKLRMLWQRVLEDQADMRVEATLDSADGLAARLPEGASVVLLDLTMPGCDPLGAAAEIRDTRPLSRVIIYSGHSDPVTVRKAVECGAWGFVDKLTSPDDVLDAIRRVAGGEAVFPATFSG